MLIKNDHEIIKKIIFDNGLFQNKYYVDVWYFLRYLLKKVFWRKEETQKVNKRILHLPFIMSPLHFKNYCFLTIRCSLLWFRCSNPRPYIDWDLPSAFTSSLVFIFLSSPDFFSIRLKLGLINCFLTKLSIVPSKILLAQLI